MDGCMLTTFTLHVCVIMRSLLERFFMFNKLAHKINIELLPKTLSSLKILIYVALYATIESTLCIRVLNDRSLTSSELAMNCGPDSPHELGTSTSLSVYTKRSN